MGTTADKLNKILDSKAKIKAAIEAKGVSNVGDVLADYPSKIESIESGSGKDYSVTIPTASGVFKLTDEIKDVNLGDLRGVTSLEYCFRDLHSLTSIQLPELPNATIMDSCFYNCSSLTSIQLPELPNVTTMSSCFDGCRSLTSIQLFGLSLVTNMGGCFNGCRSLTSIQLPELPKVNGMRWCFSGCIGLQDFNIGQMGVITNLSDWGIGSCTNLTHQSLLNIISALPNKAGNSYPCSIGTINLAKLTEEEIQVATDKGWVLS